MKYLPIFFCLLNLAFAVREKQVRLEDIEKDNLANERRTQQRPTIKEFPIPQQYIAPPQANLRIQPHYQPDYFAQALQQAQVQLQQYHHVQQYPQLQQLQQQPQLQLPAQQHVAQKQQITPPRLQYGFKPMKTQSQYSASKPQAQQYNLPTAQQYSLPQQYLYQAASQQQPQLQQQLPPSKAQQYVQSQPQYQQLELPYVTDNQLNAQDTNAYQQYYQPQYLYLQQYPAASTNIQAVVDPKSGGVQYVMYLQSQYQQGGQAEQTETVETVSQPQGQVYPQQDFNSLQGLLGGEQQIQYIQVPQAQDQIPPQAQKYAEIQYVPQQQQQPEIVPQRAPKFNFEPQKYEPKSLLDSYVPSLLQIQYFKQQQHQAQANAIQQPLKPQQNVLGKGDFAKSYVPQTAASAQSFNFQFNQYPSHGGRPQRVKQ